MFMGQRAMSSEGRLKFLGIATMLFGMVALSAPAVAAGAVIFVVGGTLLLVGISQVVQGLKGHGWREKRMPVVLGSLAVIAGLGALAHPILGLGVLSLMLAMYLAIEGIWKILSAFRFRLNPAWIWMLLTGVLSLLFSYLIWQQWPLSGLIAVGVIVGADLITTGLALVMLGSTGFSVGR
jgi:uncharacterized membrane protein HdeD (DUF308 family)